MPRSTQVRVAAPLISRFSGLRLPRSPCHLSQWRPPHGRAQTHRVQKPFARAPFLSQSKPIITRELVRIGYFRRGHWATRPPQPARTANVGNRFYRAWWYRHRIRQSRLPVRRYGGAALVHAQRCNPDLLQRYRLILRERPRQQRQLLFWRSPILQLCRRRPLRLLKGWYYQAASLSRQMQSQLKM